MNKYTRNTFADMGLEILKRAALLVLYDTTSPSEGLIQQDEVRKRLGIKNVDTFDSARHNALIYGILSHLRDDGYAYHNVGYGWRITEEGVLLIED
ncbi:hypothetical protein C6499_22830 [Candidatus Poribacteria bacterium]|nr:MAG: hypothetical protein C6499_22830 [Candidatus Poribacteria bacterium]